ncbi:MAG: glycosyltransferase family 1 protein [Aulosira sp. DedQUE10]|nr:glycosyltransferase family 1 protein [Aulosira sp. DedQUE10]
MQFSKLSKLYEKRPDIYKQHREKYNQQTALYSLISTEPSIFYVPRSLWIRGHASLEPIFDYLQSQTAYFLQNWWWDMENPKDVKTVRAIEDDHISRYPKHKFIHLCNTLRQTEIFQEYRLNAIFCNHNCLVDERIFQPIPTTLKLFNAVYDARMSSYKRHYLAKKNDNIAFIYYYDIVNDFDCYQEVMAQFPHAHFFNHSLSKTYKSLSPSAVNQCLNICKVGLCLSSVEGAMYASIQYLLSGLPVVSTRSKGGRDIFFDEEYVLIVEDDPDAVKEGVDELIRRNISADIIRHKVLEQIKQHRLVLIALIQSIYDQEGIKKNFSVEWDQLFFNKLYKLQSPDQAIKQLELAKTGL